MPNNEEKQYTVDDILSEFENSSLKGDNPDSAEETISPDEQVNVYKDTESFDENTVEAEIIITETISDDEEAVTEEIVEDDEDDDIEISEEIIETDRSEAENADIVMNAEKTLEDIVVEEIALWENNVDTEEITEAEAAAYVHGLQQENETVAETEETAENEEQPESEKMASVDNAEEIADEEPTTENQTEEAAVITTEEEDVNDKFLKKFLKGLLPWKGDGIGEIIRKIIFIIAVAVFIGAGVMLVSTLMQSEEAVEEKKENQSIITTTVATTIDSAGNVVTIAPTEEEIAEHNFNVAEHFKSINEDYIGYLEVEGCDIYEPIMQGDDNDYYLNHNYYGGTNKAGTVFLDHRCTVSEEYISPNIVFYGHNQEDGTMFGNRK